MVIIDMHPSFIVLKAHLQMCVPRPPSVEVDDPPPIGAHYPKSAPPYCTRITIHRRLHSSLLHHGEDSTLLS